MSQFRYALIDGDILVYLYGCSVDQNLPLDEQTRIAISRLNKGVRDWRDISGAVDYKGYLTESGTGNYRFKVAKTLPYKGNRKQPKPVTYHILRDHLVNELGFVMSKGEEADDLLGIALRSDPKGSIVLTRDKDLKNVPGWHCNPIDDPLPVFVTVQQAVVNFGRQVLTGDATDNVPGIFKHFGKDLKPQRKVGPVQAAKYIPDDTPPNEVWDLVMHAYSERAGEAELTWPQLYDMAMETAQLVWIRWEPDQVFDPLYLKEL